LPIGEFGDAVASDAQLDQVKCHEERNIRAEPETQSEDRRRWAKPTGALPVTINRGRKMNVSRKICVALIFTMVGGSTLPAFAQNRYQAQAEADAARRAQAAAMRKAQAEADRQYQEELKAQQAAKAAPQAAPQTTSTAAATTTTNSSGSSSNQAQ
jgi:hypothetical protein